MIIIDEITSLPAKISMKIPTSAKLDELTKLFLYDCGDASSDTATTLDCGNASTTKSVLIDLKYADNDIDSQSKILITLRHKATNKFFNFRVDITGKDGLCVYTTYTLNEMPPVGEYLIKASYGYDIIYKGILRIGEIKNNNIVYTNKYNGEQYQD